MAKLTLDNTASGYNASAKINANNDLIEAALENTISRDGTSPNTMSADFDMNGFNIVNAGTVSSGSSGGTTANRPTSPLTYQSYFDTTLTKPVWYTGTVWVDATGTTV